MDYLAPHRQAQAAVKFALKTARPRGEHATLFVERQRTILICQTYGLEAMESVCAAAFRKTVKETRFEWQTMSYVER